MVFLKVNCFPKCPKVTIVIVNTSHLVLMIETRFKNNVNGQIFLKLHSLACSELSKIEKILKIKPVQGFKLTQF